VPEFILTASPAITAAPVSRDQTHLRALSEGVVFTLILSDDAVARGALAQIGAPLPTIGAVSDLADGNRILRPVATRAYLVGTTPVPPDGLRAAGLRGVDQSDYWVGLALQGPRAVEALQRHWKPDLHLGQFAPGQTTRAKLGAAPCLMVRDTVQDFTLLVPRSLARASYAEIAETLHLLP
jgi:hypothetical protein